MNKNESECVVGELMSNTIIRAEYCVNESTKAENSEHRMTDLRIYVSPRIDVGHHVAIDIYGITEENVRAIGLYFLELANKFPVK